MDMEKVITVEKHEEKGENIITLKVERYAEPGYHVYDPKLRWYRLTPYQNSNSIPVQKLLSNFAILYLRVPESLEIYVKTAANPSIFSSIGYVEEKTPMEERASNKVYCAYTRLSYCDDHYFIDLKTNNLIDVLESLPSYSAIAVLVSINTDFEEDLTRRWINPPVWSRRKYDIGVTPRYYPEIMDKLLSSNITRVFDLRDSPIYSVNIIVFSEDKYVTKSLAKKISEISNIKLKWKPIKKTFKGLTWSDALAYLTPEKYNRKKIPTTDIRSLEALLFLPPSHLTPRIPEGTLPARLISDSNGFRLGIGADHHDFKLHPSSFSEHCVVSNISINENLLINIIKAVHSHNKVLILDGIGIAHDYLKRTGLDHTFYDLTEYSIDIFDIQPMDKTIPTLLYTIDKLSLSPLNVEKVKSSLKELQNVFRDIPTDIIANYSVDDPIKELYLTFITDEFLHRIHRAINTLRDEAAIDFLISAYTNGRHLLQPIEPFKYDLSVIGPGNPVNSNITFSAFYALLIYYLTYFRIHENVDDFFFVIIPPNIPHEDVVPFLSDHYDLLANVLELIPPHIAVILATCQHEDKGNHYVFKKVGLRFSLVNSEEARVWRKNKGSALIKVGHTDIRRAKVVLGDKLPLQRPRDLNTIRSPVFNYINLEDLVTFIILFDLYKKGKHKLPPKMDPLRRLYYELSKKEFITISNNTAIYNDGFRKWFAPAMPSLQSDLIHKLVEYYFTNGYLLLPSKQILGVPRPDAVAIPFDVNDSKLEVIYEGAIAVEIECSLDKGPNSINQAKTNMIKNIDFVETHSWTFLKFKEIISKIYDELDPSDQERVKLLFFGKDIPISENTSEQGSTEPQITSERGVKKEGTVETNELDEPEKIEKSDDKDRNYEENKETEDTTTSAGDEEARDREYKREDTIRVTWDGAIYELEKDENSELMKSIVEEIINGKRKGFFVREKDGYLRIVDNRNTPILEAKILAMYKQDLFIE